MWEYTYTDELYHYGVKGMKWGHRRGVAGTIRDIQTRNAKRDLSNAQSKRRQVNSELRELHGYAKNPSKLGSSKVSTAIRNHQINSLNKTKSKLDRTINDNKNALKELDSIERHVQQKKLRKENIKNNYKEIKKQTSFGEKMLYNDATRKLAAKYMTDNNMSMKDAKRKANKEAMRNTAALLGAYGAVKVAQLMR